ncbi:MAG: hypothetical protein ACRESZ_08520 [Methylococcales bacterium]
MILAVIIRSIPLIPVLVMAIGLITYMVMHPTIRTVTVHMVIMAGEAIIIGAEVDRDIIRREAGVAVDIIGAVVVFVVGMVAVFMVGMVAVFMDGMATINIRVAWQEGNSGLNVMQRSPGKPDPSLFPTS